MTSVVNYSKRQKSTSIIDKNVFTQNGDFVGMRSACSVVTIFLCLLQGSSRFKERCYLDRLAAHASGSVARKNATQPRIPEATSSRSRSQNLLSYGNEKNSRHWSDRETVSSKSGKTFHLVLSERNELFDFRDTYSIKAKLKKIMYIQAYCSNWSTCRDIQQQQELQTKGGFNARHSSSQ